MREILLENQKILFSDEEVWVLQNTIKYEKYAVEEAEHWEKDFTADTMEELLKGYLKRYQMIREKVADEIVNECVQNEVYEISPEIIFNEGYFKECDDMIYDFYEEAVKEWNKIDEKEKEEKEYRKIRKAYRGKWSGGGFGLTGALKGAIEAGALNAVSGAVHSVINLAGNTRTGYFYNKERKELFVEIYQTMQIVLMLTVASMVKVRLEISNDYLGKTYRLYTDEDRQVARALLNNSKKIGNVDKKKELLCKAIKRDPTFQDLYIYYLECFGDVTGGLEELAEFTGALDLNVQKRNIINEYYRKNIESIKGMTDLSYELTELNDIINEREALKRIKKGLCNKERELNFYSADGYGSIIEYKLRIVGGILFENISAADNFVIYLKENEHRFYNGRLFSSIEEKEKYMKEILVYRNITKRYSLEKQNYENYEKCIQDLNSRDFESIEIQEYIKEIEEKYNNLKSYYESYYGIFYKNFMAIYNKEIDDTGIIMSHIVSCKNEEFQYLLDQSKLINLFQKKKEKFLIIYKRDIFKYSMVLSDYYWRFEKNGVEKWFYINDIIGVEKKDNKLIIITDTENYDSGIDIYGQQKFVIALNTIIKKTRESVLYQSPEAQYQRGRELFAKKSYSEAVSWYEKSAEKGYTPALYELACCYLTGKGKEYDASTGKRYLILAKNQGFSMAYIGLALIALGEGNYSEAVLWYEMYLKKEELKNVENEEEYINVLLKLGSWFLNGKYVEKNEVKAMEYYEKAEKYGNSEAKYQLGKAFYYGTGKKQNYLKAFEYLMYAHEMGEIKAALLLGNCFFEGLGCVQDYKRAFLYFNDLRDNNNIAQYKLGLCYEYGLGCSPNINVAKYYYLKSAESGNLDASKKIKEIMGELYD